MSSAWRAARALGGLLAGDSLSLPFFIAAGMSLLSLLLAWVFLPESLPAGERLAAQGSTLGSAQDGDAGEGILDIRLWLRTFRSPIGVLFALTFISTCGLMIFACIFALYALERFGFGPQEVGVMLMALGLVYALGQGGLAGPLTRRWGDEVVIRGGLLATALGFGLMLLANGCVTILLATAFFELATALQIPAITSLTSRRATLPQGIVMGLSNSFISLGRIFGPLPAGFIFDINILLPYLAGILVMFAGFVLSWVALKPASAPSQV